MKRIFDFFEWDIRRWSREPDQCYVASIAMPAGVTRGFGIVQFRRRLGVSRET